MGIPLHYATAPEPSSNALVKPRLIRWCHQVAVVAGPAVIALGVAVLIGGWLFDSRILRTFLSPENTPMNPLTAVGFVLAGTALVLRVPRHPPPVARRVGGILAGAVLLLALLKLADFIPGVYVGIDRILFQGRLGENVMASNTAVNFLFAAVGLLLIDAEGRRRNGRPTHPSTPMILGVALVALLALMGYFYRVLALYHFSKIPMALNTALGFMLLSLGALCARPRREPLATLCSNTIGGMLARRLLPAALLIPLAGGWLHLQGEHHHLFDTAFGVTLFSLVSAVVFAALIWWNARFVHRLDVSRRRVLEALEDKHRLLRTLIDNLPDQVFVKDTESRFLLNNVSHVQVLGAHSPEEVIGKCDFDFFSHELATAYRADEQRVLQSGTAQVQKKEVGVNIGTGRKFWLSTTKVPFLGASGQVMGIVGISHDITAIKEAEEQLQEQYNQLEATNSELGAANAKLAEANLELKRAQIRLVQSEKLAGLGQMVAGVAHEINNPLAFVTNNVVVLQRDIKGLTQVLAIYRRAEATGDQWQQTVEVAREVAERVDLEYSISNLDDLLLRSREGLKRIQQIVKDLRDFARLDQSEAQDADLNTGIESTLTIVRGYAKRKQVQIEAELNALPRLSCRPAKINQVVMNLVVNAIDASPENERVLVRSTADDREIRIEVIDHGTGIEPSVRERIFDPFFTTKPVGQGTGLGLSISYGIIKDHAGEIEVESELGKGSQFIVRLPRQAEKEKRSA